MIDAHVHVWNPDHFPYHWLADAGLERTFLPPDHAQASQSGAQIFVEAAVDPAYILQEVAWVESLEWVNLLGIVAQIDISSEAVAAGRTAELLETYGRNQRVIGVRHLLQSHARLEQFHQGLALVLSQSVNFDLCITHDQLPLAVELLASADVTSSDSHVIVDHLAKPDVDAGLASASGKAWITGMEALASWDNVFVKLSGLAPESSDPALLSLHGPQFIQRAIEIFGPHRCLFASDWPVSMQNESQYQTWVQMVQEVAGPQWDHISSRTALTAYGLSTR